MIVLFSTVLQARIQKILNRGRNCINYQAEPGGANLFFGLTYKGERGAPGDLYGKSAPVLGDRSEYDRLLGNAITAFLSNDIA